MILNRRYWFVLRSLCTTFPATFLAIFLTALLTVLLTASNVTFAQETAVTLKENGPTEYTVIKGDTLWDIAGRFLEDPWRWREIWQNNQQITNPDLIYPGDIIRLLYVDGKPVLTIDRGTGISLPSTETTTAPTAEANPTAKPRGPLETVKLSPQIRAYPIDEAIPEIPLEKINNFLLRNRVLDVGVLDAAPHVVGGQDERVILGAGDDIYVRGEFDGTSSGYGIYRPGQIYIDPVTEEVLGVQAQDIGAASIRARDNDIVTFAVVRSTNEIRLGDRLLPVEERAIESVFTPRPPKTDVKGMVIAVETGVALAGRLDIIGVNLGKDSLTQGDLLAVYKQGQKVRDRFAQKKTPKNLQLPEERAGLVLIFQTFEKMSLGIVLEAERGIELEDYVNNP